MTITFEAIYEGGVLKPIEPLPLAEHDKVRVTVHSPALGQESRAASPTSAGAGLIPCRDSALIERIALDPALEYGEAALPYRAIEQP